MTKQALLEKAEEKSRELAKILADNKTADGFNLNEEGLATVKSLEAEIEELNTKAEAFTSPTTDPSRAEGRRNNMDVKNLGALIKESGAMKTVKEQGQCGSVKLQTSEESGNAGFKTVMSRTAGWAPLDPRSGVVSPYPIAPTNVLDLIPMTEAAVAIWKYMRGTTFTNNAAAAGENTTVGEAAIEYTQIDATLQKVAVSLPYTLEQMMDVPGIEDTIARDLSRAVWSKINYYALYGVAASGHPEGILGVTAGVNSNTAVGLANQFDAIYAGITACVATGMADAVDGVVATPALWQKLIATQSTAGGYLGGSPFNSPAKGLWGIPAVVSPQLAPSVSGDASAIVGAFQEHAEMIVHPEVMFDVTDSHASEFTNAVKRARLIVRVAFAWKRPSAFAKIVGITL